MNWGIITMWERRPVNNALIGFIVFSLFFTTGESFARGPGKRKKMGNLTLRKLRSKIPKSKSLRKDKAPTRNVSLIKPPPSNKFYIHDDDPGKAEYNRLVDEEIKRLYKLSKRYRKSRSRGEIWLRLGERYVEKAQIIDFKLQDNYDKKLRAYHKGKTKRRPRPPSRRPVRAYHKRAIRLYEWYIRDFPKDHKVPQALYFLGYNNFEIGNLKKGEQYYTQLTKDHPRNTYVSESHFALGEFYFEREEWGKALSQYINVVQRRKSRLNGFALYKASWCHYRLQNYKKALATLVKVIRVGGKGGSKTVEGTRAINMLRLAKEATNDFVSFYERTGRYKQAYDDFMEISGSEKKTINMVEQLAYRYSYSGNLKFSYYLFKQLINLHLNNPKSSEYQHQIVQDFGSTGRVKSFRKELSYWIDEFGLKSDWAEANKDKPEIIKKSFELQESTLRNSTLSLHNQAVSTKAKYSMKLTLNSYKMYLNYFQNSKHYVEMIFFYAELLYDFKNYKKAAASYEKVARKNPKGKYFEKAVTNSVLAREKQLPSDEQIAALQANLANKTDKIPLSPEVKAFLNSSDFYLKNFPKGGKALEIRRRLGLVYYAHNYFDSAILVLREIEKDQPKSKDVILVAEIISDIHLLRKDLIRYLKEGYEFLKNPVVANSDYGKKLRVNLEKARFLMADNFSKNGHYLKAAKAFESFAVDNSKSTQVHSALFNSASNYSKAGAIFDSIRMYKKVISKSGKNIKISLSQEARNSLGEIYKKLGQLKESAIYYESYGQNASGQKAVDAVFNAAVIWDALNQYKKAFRAYNLYANLDKNKGVQEAAWAKAEIYRRQRIYPKAIYHYDKFIQLNSSDLDRTIKALFYIGDFHRSLRRGKISEEWYKKVLRVVNGSSKGRKLGAKYAAQAQYHLSKSDLNEMRRVRLGRTDNSITTGLNKMKAIQKSLVRNMVKVIKYDYGPYVVAALSAEAESYEIIGSTFKNIPVPKEYSKGEVAKKFKAMAKGQAKDFYDKAISSYRNAFEKGLSLKAYSREMILSARDLYRLDPNEFTNAGEIGDIGQLIDTMGI